VPNTDCLFHCGNVQHYCHKPPSEYFICKECGLIFQKELPSIEAMSEHAESEYSSGLYKEYVGAAALKYETFSRRIALIKQKANGGRLLDVGCSSGFFIEVALQNGFDAYGVELSSQAISFAKEGICKRITQGDVNLLRQTGSDSYDVIVAFDIIEHTRDPLLFLRNIKGLLKPGGCIVISTPDTGHFLRLIMGSRWPMLQPLQHIFLFSKKTISRALETTGYRNLQITNAYKVLSIEYLIGQIRHYNPLLFHAYRAARLLIPESLRRKPISINIGELLVLCNG
jgi:2-polyprenyl-3-methyl-5-hydroxy-6-metoxy-1,4-benzoquinol methylase